MNKIARSFLMVSFISILVLSACSISFGYSGGSNANNPLICNPKYPPTCGGNKNYYSWALYDDPPSAGEINNEPNGYSVINQVCYTGTSFQVTAQPATGYAFAYWSGSLSGSSNPSTLNVGCPGSASLTANYEWLNIMNVYHYNSDGSISNTNSPTNGLFQTQTAQQCASENSVKNSVSEFWACQYQYNNYNWILMSFNEYMDVPACKCVGNATMFFEVWQNSAYPASYYQGFGIMNFIAANGSSTNNGDALTRNNTGTTLGDSITSLQYALEYVGTEYQDTYCGLNYNQDMCRIGWYDLLATVGVQNFNGFIQNSTNNYGSIATGALSSAIASPIVCGTGIAITIASVALLVIFPPAGIAETAADVAVTSGGVFSDVFGCA